MDKDKCYITYDNIRCRKCGAIISVKMRHSFSIPNNSLGYIISKDSKYNLTHGCKIEDGEHVYADLISYSNAPLSDAILVIDTTTINDDNKVE